MSAQTPGKALETRLFIGSRRQKIGSSAGERRCGSGNVGHSVVETRLGRNHSGNTAFLTPVLKTGELGTEAHFHIIYRTATVFSDNEFGKAPDIAVHGVVRGTEIIFRTVDKTNDIGVLLNSSRLSKVT